LEITVNSEKIDFTLENEEKLYDVFCGLQEWLNESGLVISNIAADGEFLSLNNLEKWKDRDIHSVKTVSVSAQKPSEVQLFQLRTVFQFFSELIDALNTGKSEKIKELMDDFPSVREALPDLLSDLFQQDPAKETDSLDTLFRESGIKEGTVSEEYTRRIRERCSMINIIILDRMKEITETEKELAITTGLLQNMIGELSDVSVALQTGKDRGAMATVIKYTELIQKIFRMVPYIQEKHPNLLSQKVEGKSFSEISTEMNEILTQLIEAFTVKDSVLIGDLLEYEIAPRTELLISFFQTQEELKRSDD
jgi:DNA polymerase III alpha subunit (gram-positive type)